MASSNRPRDLKKLQDDLQAIMLKQQKAYRLQVIAGNLVRSEINYEDQATSFTGVTKFEDGVPRPCRFLKFKTEVLARNAFSLNENLRHEGLMTPWDLQNCGMKQAWVLIYDTFEPIPQSTLWMDLLNIKPMDADDANLHPNWSKMIGGFFRTIKYIHCRGHFHLSLDRHESYVLNQGKIKIINIGGSCNGYHNLWWKDFEKIHKQRHEDLRAFRNMLQRHLQPELQSTDRDWFLSYFDQEENMWQRINDNSKIKWKDKINKYHSEYHKFIEKCILHPYLITPEDRMKYYYDIHQAKSGGKLDREEEFFKALADTEFKREYTTAHGPWNRFFLRNSPSYSRHLQDIYKTDKVNYNGTQIEGLIYFGRNVYEHFDATKVTLANLDKDMRKFYPGFLSRLHVNCHIKKEED